MANWLLDYIEMTEYIPPEFRDQTFAMRELDLKVSIAMSQLENDAKDFFSKIDELTSRERQEQYEALIRKCEEAGQVANAKVKIADRLHDLVEKSMRLLDQGLEKLKEDLIEGDKAYIVEDIERRSHEIDEQLRLEEQSFMQRQQRIRDAKSNHSTPNQSRRHHSKATLNNSHDNSTNNHATNNYRFSNDTGNHDQVTQMNNQSRHHNSSDCNHHLNNKQSAPNASSHPAHRPHHHNIHHNRQRNNPTGAQRITTATATATTTSASVVKQKKRNRLNSAMTIFNRNSKTDDDSNTQTTFLSSPTTPDYLNNLPSSNSNSLNDVSGGDATLMLKGMVAQRHRGNSSAGSKSNGNDPLAKARQPILTAIDAAHAVSPSATNSDKLVLLTSNSNGDTYDGGDKQQMMLQINQAGEFSHNQHHPISPVEFNNQKHTLFNSNSDKILNNSVKPIDRGGLTPSREVGPFSGLSHHDPIMMAASQAINATQSMTSGRRTSSLKASYAAVNSGRLQHPGSNHLIFNQATLTGEVYCKCRGAIHDSDMIACDNVNCKIEWFHYACVGITAAPPGEWYCDDCKASLSNHYSCG